MDQADIEFVVDFGTGTAMDPGSGALAAPAPKRRGRPPKDPNAPPRTAKPRRERDDYPTVDDLARVCVERVKCYRPSPVAVLEPTAGDGSFVKAARTAFPDAKVGAVDIDPSKRDPCVQAGAHRFVESDILQVDPSILSRFDLIIGNPPFCSAAEIIDYLRKAAPQALIAFLLPVSFFGRTMTDRSGTARDAAFWERVRLSYFAAIHPRPSFTGDGRTDRMEYGLYGFGDPSMFGSIVPVLGEPIVWEK